MDEVLAREFVVATNRMYESLTIYQVDQSHGHRDSRDLLECARTGCSLLSNDMYVHALVEDARAFQERRWLHRKDMRIITGRGHFEHFLRIERSLLQEAGTNPGLTEDIISRCREARKATRQGKFDANAFRGALEELRHAVCDVFADLREPTFDQPPPHQLPRRLWSVLTGVCGCVVVALDYSSLAATVGLSAAGSQVSVAVGSGIVGKAITDLWGPGCYPRWLSRRFRTQVH